MLKKFHCMLLSSFRKVTICSEPVISLIGLVNKKDYSLPILSLILVGSHNNRPGLKDILSSNIRIY